MSHNRLDGKSGQQSGQQLGQQTASIEEELNPTQGNYLLTPIINNRLISNPEVQR
ncbi:12833_t:CDS:2 [Racocetra fulgida]|uniref:12833_t:CDS:1 n=1 Tax=Racocetra fulgida TaxID=60492 RepID=A0A9N9AZ89_9GLOM|nr:12833_t:CDS:2 [Racocetra fulgida]